MQEHSKMLAVLNHSWDEFVGQKVIPVASSLDGPFVQSSVPTEFGRDTELQFAKDHQNVFRRFTEQRNVHPEAITHAIALAVEYIVFLRMKDMVGKSAYYCNRYAQVHMAPQYLEAGIDESCHGTDILIIEPSPNSTSKNLCAINVKTGKNGKIPEYDPRIGCLSTVLPVGMHSLHGKRVCQWVQESSNSRNDALRFLCNLYDDYSFRLFIWRNLQGIVKGAIEGTKNYLDRSPELCAPKAPYIPTAEADIIYFYNNLGTMHQICSVPFTKIAHIKQQAS